MIVSAYDNNDKLVEGKMRVTPMGNKVVLTENGYTNISNLNHVRFIEEEEDEVDKKVTDDVSHITPEALKDIKEEELKIAGDKREKELKDAGMKIQDQEYSTKFVIQAANKAAEASGGVDQAAADFKNSEALKGMGESIKPDTTDTLHPDYQDVAPYEDSKTRDEIYLSMKQEIDNYGKSTKRFDNSELEEHLCNKLLNGFIVHGSSLKESFSKIYKLCTLRELTTAKVVDAIIEDGEEALRNKFIKLRDMGKEDYNPEDKLEFINELVDQLKSSNYSEAEVAEILGKWFGIGGTYEFNMDVLNKIARAKEEGEDITVDHPNWYPQNEKNVWNNGTNIQQEFA